MSLLIGLVILGGGWRVLKEAIHVLNEGAPYEASARDVIAAMADVPAVVEVHDVHVWTIGPGYRVLTAHVLLANRPLSETDTIMRNLKEILSHRFGMEHTTIQFECADCGQGHAAVSGRCSEASAPGRNSGEALSP